MLKKLRLKFVCYTMIIVTVMLCVIFGLVLGSMARSLEQENIRMLRDAAAGPPGLPRPGQFSQPYFALQAGPEGVTVISGGDFFDLTDEAYLESILEAASQPKENTGILQNYGLRYYRARGMRGQQILFADISVQRQMLWNLTLICLTVGIGAFGLFLGISLVLARWAVRPVEQAWQEQRQFVADASHELKTPLTVIMTNAELLSQTAEEEKRQQCIGSIRAMSQRMRLLVEGLLELARVDNGAVQKAFEKTDLSQLVSDTVLPFEAVFFEAGLTLDMQLVPGICVMGSAAHLRQTVEILLDNARKYAIPGSLVTLRLEKESSRECRLLVENQGEAIGREDLENIFKRFYRVDPARTGGSGYGLGLPIAKAIVEDHGGKIWAASEHSVNTFYIKLPTV